VRVRRNRSEKKKGSIIQEEITKEKVLAKDGYTGTEPGGKKKAEKKNLVSRRRIPCGGGVGYGSSGD